MCDDKLNLQAYLKENGIGTRDMYPPLNDKKHIMKKVISVSFDVGKRGLWFPSAAQLP